MSAQEPENHRFNLSAWALTHQTLVLFFIVAATVAGFFSYMKLGRAEDPSFTFKVMVIQTEWPGATAREVELLVTEPIEKTLESVPYYDFARSYSRPGQSTIILTLKDWTPPKLVQELWYQTRKKVGDIRGNLPSGVRGPYFNDEFGDVYSTIYAVMGDDYSPEALRKISEAMRDRLLAVPDVEKVDLLGVQDQRIYVEISSRKLAAYGVTPTQVIDAIRRDNDIAAAGDVETGPDRVFMRIDVGFDDPQRVRSAPIQIGNRQITVSDVAEVKRGYVDPKQYTIRYKGRDAVGIGVVMAKRGNVLILGKALETELAKIKAELPAGVEIGQIADQPKVVETSIHEFIESLIEALAIVMAVSFLSLGWRTGIVVALAVPLVLAMTLVAMLVLHIDLHRISLGALILALGLLVDDAIIAVEMMVVKMEQGWDRLRAGAFAYTSTAFPMLTGTIVTAAGFVPVGFAASAAGEYTNAIFWVVGLSLLLSWIVAVIFTPYLGFHLLPKPRHVAEGEHHDVYDTRVYRSLRRIIEGCVRWRWVTIGVTLVVFVSALVGFGLVQQQFFPSASRAELVVDLRLAEGSSFAATDAEMRRMETILAADPNVDYYAAYTGRGSPRFYLPLDEQLQQANFGQFLIMTKGLREREIVKKSLEERAEADFPSVRMRVARLENGPPVGYPVQFRVNGDDPQKLREIAYQVRDALRQHPNLTNVNLDWDELAKRVRVEVDLSKARILGINKADLSTALNLAFSGQTVSQYREGTRLIDVVLRLPDDERLDLARIGEINLPTSDGKVVPLSQVAAIKYELEEPILWRRGRVTNITVRADTFGGVQAPVVSVQMEKTLAPLIASLPAGYSIGTGGEIEESAKGQQSILDMMPVMVLIMVTTLMIQLQSFSKVALVLITAPLGVIGVTAALLISKLPFGFVAMLGTIALAGIIMRNSVILVDQIGQDVAAGHTPWQAVIDATVRRARPIALTAAAAILAMIPLAPSAFWGPMAVAIMGGLTGATFLTIFFLPALYAAWFRVRQDRHEVPPLIAVHRQSAALVGK